MAKSKTFEVRAAVSADYWERWAPKLIRILREMSEEEFREGYKPWRAEYMRRWRKRRGVLAYLRQCGGARRREI